MNHTEDAVNDAIETDARVASARTELHREEARLREAEERQEEVAFRLADADPDGEGFEALVSEQAKHAARAAALERRVSAARERLEAAEEHVRRDRYRAKTAELDRLEARIRRGDDELLAVVAEFRDKLAAAALKQTERVNRARVLAGAVHGASVGHFRYSEWAGADRGSVLRVALAFGDKLPRE